MRGLIQLLIGAAWLAVSGVCEVAAQQPAPAAACDTIVMKGAPLGAVKYTHKAHEKTTKCVSCHHASLPAKPLRSPYQPCGECHTKVAAAPMKTSIRDAHHDALGKKGICIDCHVKETAAGKAAPVKCQGCHKR